MTDPVKCEESVYQYLIMKPTTNELDRLHVDSIHELPLFAASCHLIKKESAMSLEGLSGEPQSVAGASVRSACDATDRTQLAGLDACAAPAAEFPEIASRIIDNEAKASSPVLTRVKETDRLTLDDIKAAIASWTHIDIRRRLNWASSLNRVERIIFAVEAERPPPEGVDRWACKYLNQTLWTKPAAHAGIAEATLATTVSDLRQVLMRLGRHADAGPRRNLLSPAWAALHAALPTRDRQNGVVSFMRFLTVSGIEPDGLSPNALDHFENWVRTQMLAANIVPLVRQTASGWNWARANIAGWPQVELARPDMRDEYTLPLEAMPPSFQADVTRFVEGLTGGNRRNPYRDPATINHASGEAHAVMAARIRRGRAVSPETIRHRLKQIRCAVAALIDAGVPVGSIQSLHDLVTPTERPRAILQFHLGRLKARKGHDPDAPAGEEATSTHVAGIAELLRIIAVHHGSMPTEEIADILDLRAAVRMPAQGEMNQNVSRKLRALHEPDTLAILLATPDEWMRQVNQSGLKPVAAATLAMRALALEIALTVPLRRRNLVALHRDRHLVRDRRTGKAVALDIPAAATKTRRRPIIWEFPPRLIEMVASYERDFLPILAQEGNRFLFPGQNGKHRDFGDFADDLSRRVEREIGDSFNLHLVRHLTAYRILKRRPGAYELVSRVLGHSSTVTTRQYYCGLEMVFAVREATRLLELDRIEARPTQARITAMRKRLRGRRRKTPRAPVIPSRGNNDADA